MRQIEETITLSGLRSVSGGGQDDEGREDAGRFREGRPEAPSPPASAERVGFPEGTARGQSAPVSRSCPICNKSAYQNDYGRSALG